MYAEKRGFESLYKCLLLFDAKTTKQLSNEMLLLLRKPTHMWVKTNYQTNLRKLCENIV